jgi:hypothetical protein
MPPSGSMRAAPPVELPEDEPDPQLIEEVERALDAYRELLPPDALEAMREEMLAFATGHPAMRELWLRARPRPVLESSGFVPTGN